MELRIEHAAYLRPPKQWALVKRMSHTRIGWDVIGAFETEREAREAMKQRKIDELSRRAGKARHVSSD